MKITSVNIGKAKAIATKSGQTGIYKNPVSEPVSVGELGLEGDTIVDVENHGGVDQAIYLYGTSDYAWWESELGRELEAGIFGENITISDLESETLCIGDKLQVGTAILQVTSPRIPCVTLATRMEDPQFVKKFMTAGRYGAYCRVLQSGQIQQGDEIVLIPYDRERVSINVMADAYYAKNLTREMIETFLNIPIAVRGRSFYKEKLAQLA